MSKLKLLAVIASLGVFASAGALADSRWQSRPSSPKVQVGLNIVVGGYGYAPARPVVIRPAVVWYPAYAPAYVTVSPGGYRYVTPRGYRKHHHRQRWDRSSRYRDRCDD
ncbi:MAG: hypothetical protein R3F24_06370 [Gammaproteobacteria bacterium]